MAGYGRRSSELGTFKPFIQVGDREIFKHCIDGLGVLSDDTVLCILSKETAPDGAAAHISDYFIKIGITDVTVVKLDEVPDGPALTVRDGIVKAIESGYKFKDGQTHVVNIDQIISYKNIELSERECAMPLYFNNTGASCYVELSDDFKTITDIKEKKLISAFASAGAYAFGSIRLLLDCIEWGVRNPESWVTAPNYDTKELFIGPCMKYAILNGMVCYPVGVESKIDLGSTNAINKAKNKMYEYSIR